MKWDNEWEWMMMDDGCWMLDDGWWRWWRDVKLKAEALVLTFELNLSVVQTVSAALCNVSLENVGVVSMGVHFRIARGARVSWFPSNDLANTSSLHFILSIYRRWVVVSGRGRTFSFYRRRSPADWCQWISCVFRNTSCLIGDGV